MTNQTQTTSFEEYIQNSDLPVLVDFYADWCGPCKMLKPILEEVAKDWSGKAKVIKVDTDAQQHLAMKYGIQGIPTLILFKHGKEVHRTSGVLPADRLKAAYESYL
ncbi:MAG: thioredoxin [Leptospiraceae bacterium]|nr:thioredoxin [Leptospiraceae bacterium]